VDRTLRLIEQNWVVLAYNFNIVFFVLIIGESSIGSFLLTILLQFYPYYYLALSFYPCTCGVPTISVLNLVIFSVTQTCCLEGEYGLEFFDEEF
jgi:hypothetical protein